MLGSLFVYCRGVEEAGVLVEVTSFPFKTEFLMSSVVMVNEVFLSELQSQHPLWMSRVISAAMICED